MCRSEYFTYHSHHERIETDTEQDISLNMKVSYYIMIVITSNSASLKYGQDTVWAVLYSTVHL